MTWEVTEKRRQRDSSVLFATTLLMALSALGAVYGIWHTSSAYQQLVLRQEQFWIAAAEAATTKQLVLDTQNALSAYLAFGRSADLDNLRANDARIRQMGQGKASSQLTDLLALYDQWYSQFATPLLKERALLDAGRADWREFDALFISLKPDEWGQKFHAQGPYAVVDNSVYPLSNTDAQIKNRRWNAGFAVVTLGIMGFMGVLATLVNLIRLRKKAVTLNP